MMLAVASWYFEWIQNIIMSEPERLANSESFVSSFEDCVRLYTSRFRRGAAVSSREWTMTFLVRNGGSLAFSIVQNSTARLAMILSSI